MMDPRQEWGTPRKVFEALHRDYGFTVDVCATAANAKLPAFLTAEDDALSCSWEGERIFCNPPYADIDPWIAKATEPDLAYFLLPARTFNEWWGRWSQWARKEWFIGRMRFEPPEGITPTSIPFPIVGFLFRKGPDGYPERPGHDILRDAHTGRIL